MPDNLLKTKLPESTASFTTVETAIAANLKSALQVAYRQLGDWETARDVVQDAVLEVLQHSREAQMVDNFRAWFLRIVLNRCTDWYRRWQRFRRWQIKQWLQGETDSSGKAAGEADWFQSVVRQLPRKQRMIVILRYQENFTVEEIADMLNISADTVRVHLMRARQRIRQFLEKKND